MVESEEEANANPLNISKIRDQSDFILGSQRCRNEFFSHSVNDHMPLGLLFKLSVSKLNLVSGFHDNKVLGFQKYFNNKRARLVW